MDRSTELHDCDKEVERLYSVGILGSDSTPAMLNAFLKNFFQWSICDSEHYGQTEY